MSETKVSKREALIDKSGVRSVFTPRAPIRHKSFLFGRTEQLTEIIGSLSTPGGHALIFGERGIGKTSLANVVIDHFTNTLGAAHVHKHACEKHNTLREILAKPLTAAGVDLHLKEVTTSHEQSGDAKVSAVFAAGGIASTRSRNEIRRPEHEQLTAALVVERIGARPGLLVVDEVDMLVNSGVTWQIAVLIKQLSDTESPFKICLVGVGTTVRELLGGHESSSRALAEIMLPRLDDSELRGIIVDGFNRLTLGIDEEVVIQIVRVCAGYPYFAHLIALKCAEAAVAEVRTRIKPEHLAAAWVLAVKTARQSLGDVFKRATSYDAHSPHAKVLRAASECCNSKSSRDEDSHFSGEELQARLVAHDPASIVSDRDLALVLYDLVSESKVLRALTPRHFRFADPRLPIYINLTQLASPQR